MVSQRVRFRPWQDKVNFLAGGTDGEQLAEVLMEKEEVSEG
jgi:hypothetical protein